MTSKVLTICALISLIVIYGKDIMCFRAINIKDKYTIYSFLFCFLILIKVFTGNGFGVELFPVSHYVLFFIQYKINFPVQMLIFFVLSHYFHSLFPKETNRKIMKFMNALFLFSTVIILFLNLNQNRVITYVNYSISSLFALWHISLLIIAIKKKKCGALLLLFGLTLFLLTVLNDILYFHRILDTFFISDFGMILCLMSAIIVLQKMSFYNLKYLENSAQSLQNDVKKGTEELENAKKEIRVQSEQNTSFFINFADEIKIPLAIIQNNLNEYLKKAKVTKELKIIKAHIHKLYRDIVNLLDCKKLEQGTLLYNNDTVIDASESLMNIIDQFKILAWKKKISITFSGENSLFLKIDPYAFESVINNIVDNAIKYTGENGHIEVNITSKADNIIITIQDDGIGISQTHLDNIFLPYYQVSRKKCNKQGLGLGLSIVKNILANFNGRIEVN
ncbi:MAG: ATP-binding protein, partial [Spirochaetales bacterium]|nr:ATP-binding protein [Spirochaetales bacterium]